MTDKIFAVITNFSKKHKFQNNAVIKSFIPVYHWFQRLVTTRVKLVPGSASMFATARQDNFLAENAGRVSAVADMLADDKSKETYLGIIKFRQTGLKKDFPFKHYEKRQYFIDELRLGKDEVFIDCGAFNGDTLDAFFKHCGDCRRAVAFEPDSKNFGALQKKYGNRPNVTLINAGVYDRDGELRFDMQENGESRIVDSVSENIGGESACILVKSIDGLSLSESVSFIKMDVEGAETNALKGAEKTILRDKPKLAICIYHSNEDMVRIAEYIHGLLPEYKLYVRQHFLFPSCAETVLYAVMP